MTTRYGARSAQPRRLSALLASELAELPAGIRPAGDATPSAQPWSSPTASSAPPPPTTTPQAHPAAPAPADVALADRPDPRADPRPDHARRIAVAAGGRPADPRGTAPQSRPSLGWLAVFSLAVSPAAVLLALVAPGVIYDTLQWTVSGVLGACALRLMIANRPARALHTVGRRWAAKLPGPAWWLTGFGSLDPPAAIRLGRAVCDLADTAGAVLLAVAEGTAYIHAYQRAGFAVHRQVHVDQQPCALLVRRPRTGEKQQPPTSRDASGRRSPGELGLPGRGSRVFSRSAHDRARLVRCRAL